MDMVWFGKVWYVSQWAKQYSVRITRASGMQAHARVENELLPAKLCEKPGRKKKKAYESYENPDPGRPLLRNQQCGHCGRYGHNRKGCKAPDIDVIAYKNRAGARRAVQR